MGVDTDGCVITKNKDVFQIRGIINSWWQNVRKENNVTMRDYWQEDPQWKHPRTEFSDQGTMCCYFMYKGEDRRLFIAVSCDYDLDSHKDEISGDSCIWLSFGCWGSSIELMQSLLNEFKKQEWVERCYIDESDSDEHGFKEV
jgi:hypothetical protein